MPDNEDINKYCSTKHFSWQRYNITGNNKETYIQHRQNLVNFSLLVKKKSLTDVAHPWWEHSSIRDSFFFLNYRMV